MADPCPHISHAAFVEVYQLTDERKPDGRITGYTAELRIYCAACDEPFEFIGLPAGLSSSRPTADVPATTARLPIKPASAPANFGQGIPGFGIKFTGGDDLT